ncbi:hypothetical protein K3172_11410 [Qipengyuania sp. 6B39]|uniref:hypothetical protein n=1 Tax=Qipengyuania proteolytica TaxID=2867239 RepID=UPI001C89C55C|nr:hypothetical protein [Qipengyuania proteolytica]MBX7496462.1 hypothetical protein [Qipengyuania proteolytica]
MASPVVGSAGTRTPARGQLGLTVIGSAAFSGSANELRYFQSATRTIVKMDTNRDGNADAYLRLDGLLNPTAGDCVLVNAPILVDACASDAAVASDVLSASLHTAAEPLFGAEMSFC